MLEQALNSDLPGELKALVSSNVYDTASGRYLLIPQGSRLVGVYNSRIGYGQDGVQVVWDRVIYPDGSSLDLSGMIGQDAHGFSGFRDKVDRHYTRLDRLRSPDEPVCRGLRDFPESKPITAHVSEPRAGRRKRRRPAGLRPRRADHKTKPQRSADDQGRRRISIQRQSKSGHSLRCSIYACFSQPLRPSSKLSEPKSLSHSGHPLAKPLRLGQANPR